MSSDEVQLSPQKGKVKIQLTYYYWLTTPSLSRIPAVIRSSVLLHPVICFTSSGHLFYYLFVVVKCFVDL
ncbi:MAG: hypothetical protein ACLFO6_02630, partial [Archaeoglobaceae archaeon]